MPAVTTRKEFKPRAYRTFVPVHKIWEKQDGTCVPLGGLGEWVPESAVNFDDEKSFVRREKPDGTITYHNWASAYYGHLLPLALLTEKKMPTQTKSENHLSLVFKDVADLCYYVVELGPVEGARSLSAMKSLIADFDPKIDMNIRFRANGYTEKKAGKDQGKEKVGLYPVFWQELGGQRVDYESRLKDKDGNIVGPHLSSLPEIALEKDDFTGETKENNTEHVNAIKMRFRNKFKLVKFDDFETVLQELDPQFYEAALQNAKSRFEANKATTSAYTPAPAPVVTSAPSTQGQDRTGQDRNPAIGSPFPVNAPPIVQDAGQSDDLPF